MDKKREVLFKHSSLQIDIGSKNNKLCGRHYLDYEGLMREEVIFIHSVFP